MSKKTAKTQVLAESAMMVALSIAIFAISDFIPWPFAYGGGFTLFGQVPIVLISYRHGVKNGIAAAFVLALFELFMGFKNVTYAANALGMATVIFADYIIAFTCLGIGGVFKGKLKNRQTAELILGGLTVCIIRFLCHFISGVTVWSGYCPEGQAVAVYSLIYNGSYMLVETILTVVGLGAVSAAFNLKKKRIS